MKKIIKFLFYSFFLATTSFANFVPTYGAKYIDQEYVAVLQDNLYSEGREYDLEKMLVSSSCDNFMDENVISCFKSYSYYDEDRGTSDFAFEHTHMDFTPGEESFDISLKSEGSLIGYNSNFVDLKPSYNSGLGQKIYRDSNAFIENLLIEEDSYDDENRNILSIMKSAMVSLKDGEFEEIDNISLFDQNGLGVDDLDFIYTSSLGIVDLDFNSNEDCSFYYGQNYVCLNSNIIDFSENSANKIAGIISSTQNIIIEYSDDLEIAKSKITPFNPIVINFNEEDINSYILLNLSNSEMYPDISFVSEYGTDYPKLFD